MDEPVRGRLRPACPRGLTSPDPVAAPTLQPAAGRHPAKIPGQRTPADRGKRPPGTVLLCCAALLLLALAVAQGYVSWRAQYGFVFAAKREHLPSVLETLGLDTGAVIFALLGLAHARMGRPARIERTLNLACAFGSMTSW